MERCAQSMLQLQNFFAPFAHGNQDIICTRSSSQTVTRTVYAWRERSTGKLDSQGDDFKNNVSVSSAMPDATVDTNHASVHGSCWKKLAHFLCEGGLGS